MAPLVTPWYLLLPISISLLGVAYIQNNAIRTIWIIGSFLVLSAILSAWLDAVFGSAALAAALLTVMGRREIAACVLVPHISLVATVSAIFSDYLAVWHFENLAAPLVMLLVVWAVVPRHWILALSVALVEIVTSSFLGMVSAVPAVSQIALAFPVAAFMGTASLREINLRFKTFGFAVFVLAPSAMIWLSSPPRTPTSYSLILPDDDEAYESKFFKNYSQILENAGIRLTSALNAEDIPHGAFVFMPWLSSEFDKGADAARMEKISTIAHERMWTIIAAAEHTNYGDNLSRIALLAGKGLAKDLLTVPPGNADSSGPLRRAGFLAWPLGALLNRGTSLSITGFSDRVLLAADGWWAEPNIGEWLWAGDYKWSKFDRSGRLVLASTHDNGGARWVIIGDTGPFLNEYVLAEPTVLLHVLLLATLWPMLVADTFIFTIVFLLFLTPVSSQRAKAVAVSSAAIAMFIGVVLDAMSMELLQNFPARRWKVGSYNDPQSFSVMMAQNLSKITDVKVTRYKDILPEEIHLEVGAGHVFFGLVGDVARIGDVTLSDCRRLGGLDIAQGPRLMDAQACAVSGDAQILIGNATGAAAVLIKGADGFAIIVLDKGFLSRHAPTSNMDWLSEQLPNQK